MMRGLALAVALAGCASGSELTDAQLVGPFVLPQGSPEACSMAFDPVPELAEATQRAAERWSAATGCDVRVEAGGSPVELWPAVYAFERPDGSFDASETNESGDGLALCAGMFDGAVYVSASKPGCPSLDVTIAHELGHAFGAPHTHAESGLARASLSSGSLAIDAGTLDWACSVTPCPAFQPEE